ncbi:transposable element Tcb2 transposase [Trichonephila clavipes]|nr:transposable element Tcb2 transposase [Trichonephila clavipes]
MVKSPKIAHALGTQYIQLLPWPANSSDLLPIENARDLVGWRLARDPHPVASKDELLLCLQAIWNSLPEADIKICLTRCHVV